MSSVEMHCPRCGAPMEGTAVRGLCVACIWSSVVGLGGEAEFSGSLESSGAPGAAFFSSVAPAGYSILGELGRGGMGIVYCARQEASGREVAMKMLLPFQATSEEMRARFRQEVRAIAKVDHPHILPVYHTGDQAGLPFFTMKLAGGGTLARRVTRYRGRYRDIAALMATVADAIHSAHLMGVLHRDVKPGNVLFDEADRAYVADFGLAKLMEVGAEETPDITRTVALLGTPRYLAPEVAAQGAGRATIGSDIYGLGAILYELMTGRPPWENEDLSRLLQRITSELPMPPRRIEPTIPRDLETVCLKCLNKEPEHRYGSAAELGNDLRRWLENRPITARPIGRGERFRQWVQRNPVTSVLLLLLLVLAGIAGVQSFRALESGREARTQLIVAQQANETAQRELRKALLGQARLARFSASLDRRDVAVEALTRAVTIGSAADVLEDAMTSLALIQARDLGVQIPNPEGQSKIAFDPSLTRYLWHGLQQSSLEVRSFPDHRLVKRIAFEEPSYADYVHWMPDGDGVIVQLRTGRLSLLSVSTGDTLWSVGTSRRDKTMYADVGGVLAVDATGALLAVIESDERVQIRSTRSGVAVKSLTLPAQPVVVDFHPAASVIAVGTVNGVYLVDWVKNEITQSRQPSHHYRSLAWSPNGQYLAATAIGMKLDLWHVGGWASHQVEGLGGFFSRVLLSRDGHWLAQGTGDGVLTIRHALSARPLLEGLNGFPLRFSDDGRLLYCLSGLEGVRVYELSPSACFGELQVPFWADQSLPGVAISPDDKWLAASSYAAGLLVWDLEDQAFAEWSRYHGLHSPFYAHGGAKLLACSEQGIHVWDWHSDPVDGHLRGPRILEEGLCTSSRHPTFTHGAVERAVLSVDERVWALPLHDIQAREQYPGHDQETAAMSPDGKWLADSSFHSPLYVRNLEDGVTMELSPQGGMVSFSPHGDRLVVGRGGAVDAWDVATWAKAWTLKTKTVQPSSGHCIFRPQGDLLATMEAPTQLVLIRPTDGKRLLRLNAPRPGPIGRYCFSPSGRIVAASLEDGRIQIWRLDRFAAELEKMGLDWESLVAMPRIGRQDK